MRNKIFVFGSFSAGLYALITLMSKGFPPAWCAFIDRITFRIFSEEVSNMANGFYYDVNNKDMPTLAFLLLFYVVFAVWLYMSLHVEKKGGGRTELFLIVLFACLFRFILLPGELIHENDIYRYLWDGKSINHGINPYKYAPSDLFMYEEGMPFDYYDEDKDVVIQARNFTDTDKSNIQKLLKLRDANEIFYSRIGHWQVPTIYPPAAQGVFAVSTFLKQDSLVVLKFIFILFDISALFLIVILLRHFGLNPNMCIIYGWSPLVLREFANAGHYDAVMIFFTLLGLYLILSAKRMRGISVLALATLTKFFSAALLPLLAKKLKTVHILVFCGLIGAVYLPFFVWDNTGPKGVFQGLLTYNEEWAYNASFFALIYVLVDLIFLHIDNALFISKIIVGIFYCIFIAWLSVRPCRSDLDLLRRCFLAVSVLFIVNPVGDPWYFCWSMPFLCFFPYRSWLLLSGLLVFSYINFQSDVPFVGVRFLNIPVVSWIIYVPFFIAVMTEFVIKPKWVK